mgnify:FL=1
MYYEKMSVLLDELIKRRKENTIEYEKYLQEIIDLSRKTVKPSTTADYPPTLTTPAERSLYDNLGRNEACAIELNAKILSTKKDGWRDHRVKLKEVRLAVAELLRNYDITDENHINSLLELIKNQREY